MSLMATGILWRAYHINDLGRWANGTALDISNCGRRARAHAKDVVMPATRILLVDDYPDALEIWGMYLRSLGYDVETAEDGLTAVQQALKHTPDIIVLDLELPGITGYEAARRLRQMPDTAAVPLIAATGYSHAAQLTHARECGFDSIMVKPCEPAALVSEIERLLEQSRRHRVHRPRTERAVVGVK